MSAFKCFESNLELRSAVVNYTLLDNSPTSAMSVKYGYPLASWCVDDITDFSGIFQDLVDFNEFDVKNWSVSNAVTMSHMVRNRHWYWHPTSSLVSSRTDSDPRHCREMCCEKESRPIRDYSMSRMPMSV
jgi:Mycoplasma protein of unknown function, DUF285